MAPKSSSSLRLPATPVAVFAHLLAVAVAALVLSWLLNFREGLAFRASVKAKIFNLHPLLMIIGFVLIAGEAIMAYKTIPARRAVKKGIHLNLNLIALLSGIIGVYAVFKFHREAGIPHVYTLHSWFGISTISLFGAQWALALSVFVFPKAKKAARASYVPWHSLCGIIIFFMAIITAETGLTEKFVFLSLKQNQESLFVNFIGVLLFLFAVFVGLAALLP